MYKRCDVLLNVSPARPKQSSNQQSSNIKNENKTKWKYRAKCVERHRVQKCLLFIVVLFAAAAVNWCHDSQLSNAEKKNIIISLWISLFHHLYPFVLFNRKRQFSCFEVLLFVFHINILHASIVSSAPPMLSPLYKCDVWCFIFPVLFWICYFTIIIIAIATTKTTTIIDNSHKTDFSAQVSLKSFQRKSSWLDDQEMRGNHHIPSVQ